MKSAILLAKQRADKRLRRKREHKLGRVIGLLGEVWHQRKVKIKNGIEKREKKQKKAAKLRRKRLNANGTA